MFLKEFTKYKLSKISNGVQLPNFEIKQEWLDSYNLGKEYNNTEKFLWFLIERGFNKKIDKNDDIW